MRHGSRWHNGCFAARLRDSRDPDCERIFGSLNKILKSGHRVPTLGLRVFAGCGFWFRGGKKSIVGVSVVFELVKCVAVLSAGEAVLTSRVNCLEIP
jgi:hypothetical protein